MRWLESWSLGTVCYGPCQASRTNEFSQTVSIQGGPSPFLCVEVCVLRVCICAWARMLEDLCFLADWKLTTRKAFSIALQGNMRHRAAQSSPQSCCTQLSWVLSTEDDSAVSTPMETPLLFCYNWYVIELPTLPGGYL